MVGGTEKGRNVLTAALAAMFAGGGGGAGAQEEPVRQALEEVLVTGSRIERSGLNTPTPVTTVSRDELNLLGPKTLMNALDQLPQFLSNDTLEITQARGWGGYLGSGGQQSLNMRGMGRNRTLVLVNGRRLVASNRAGAVDISVIPSSLISRTEVVTGGASAAYGSDAVAGVTNFILDTEFTGVEIGTQGSRSRYGDADSGQVNIAGGFAIGERTHVVIAAESYSGSRVRSWEETGRDWFKNWGDIDYGATGGVPNQTPQRVRYENVVTRAHHPHGLIRFGPLAGTTFDAQGNPVPFVDGAVLDTAALAGLASVTAANPRGVIQGNHVVGDVGSGQRIRHPIISPMRRTSLFTNVKVDLTENVTASFQAIAAENYFVPGKGGYTLSGSWPITIYRDNAFLDEGLRAQMDELGITSFRMDKDVDPLDPQFNAYAPQTTKMRSFTGALEGTLVNEWKYRFYYQYGETNRINDIRGFEVDRMYRAIDAVRHPETGEIVCSSTLIRPDDGCAPMNMFGFGNASEAAIAYTQGSMWTKQDLTQHATEFAVDGPVHGGWGAGPVYLAAGVTWRRDKIHQLSGDDVASPIPQEVGEGYVTAFDTDGTQLFRGLPAAYELSAPLIDRTGAASFGGSVNVWEAFFENIIPVIRGGRGVRGVDLSLSARYTSYQRAGDVVSWKAGFDWQIVDPLRFRLTRSRDIRAANLSEQFDETVQRWVVNPDPWRPTDESYIARLIVGGNPEVEPERADTLTFGFVYEPARVAGLGMSVDYYDIRIASAISSIGVVNIIDHCYDFGSFCNQLYWLPNSDGIGERPRIEAIRNVNINVGQFRVTGMDLEFRYRAPVDFFAAEESLSLRLLGSHLMSSTTTPFNSASIEQVGAGDRQKWHVTGTANYSVGAWSLGWSTRWVSSAVRNRNWVTGIDVDNNRIPSHALSNLRLNYTLDRSSASISIYGSINNVFDRNPGDLKGLVGIYDDIGRNYTVGVSYRR